MDPCFGRKPRDTSFLVVSTGPPLHEPHSLPTISDVLTDGEPNCVHTLCCSLLVRASPRLHPVQEPGRVQCKWSSLSHQESQGIGHGPGRRSKRRRQGSVSHLPTLLWWERVSQNGGRCGLAIKLL